MFVRFQCIENSFVGRRITAGNIKFDAGFILPDDIPEMEPADACMYLYEVACRGEQSGVKRGSSFA